MEFNLEENKLTIRKNNRILEYSKEEFSKILRDIVNNNYKKVRDISTSKLIYESGELRFEVKRFPRDKDKIGEFYGCLKCDNNVTFLGKEQLKKLVLNILGKEEKQIFKNNINDNYIKYELKESEENIIFKNSICKKDISISKSIIGNKFLKLMLEEKRFVKLPESLAFDKKLDRFLLIKRDETEYPCSICENNKDIESIQIINSTSPFNICSNCYMKFLCSYVDFDEKDVIVKSI